MTPRRRKTELDLNVDPIEPLRKALAARIEPGCEDTEVGLDSGDAQGAEDFHCVQFGCGVCETEASFSVCGQAAQPLSLQS